MPFARSAWAAFLAWLLALACLSPGGGRRRLRHVPRPPHSSQIPLQSLALLQVLPHMSPLFEVAFDPESDEGPSGRVQTLLTPHTQHSPAQSRILLLQLRPHVSMPELEPEAEPEAWQNPSAAQRSQRPVQFDARPELVFVHGRPQVPLPSSD